MEWLRKPEEEAEVLMEGAESEKLRKPVAAPGLHKLKKKSLLSLSERRSFSFPLTRRALFMSAAVLLGVCRSRSPAAAAAAWNTSRGRPALLPSRRESWPSSSK